MPGYSSCLSYQCDAIKLLVSLSSGLALIQQQNCLGLSSSHRFPGTEESARELSEICSRYTRRFYRAVLVRCLSQAAGMVSRGNTDTSFLSQVHSWALGFRQERKAPVSFLLLLVHQGKSHQLAPKTFFRDKKGRHQFKRKLVVSLFSHKTENGRSSWSMHVNMCMSHPPPTPWWN